MKLNPAYGEKIKAAREKSGENCSVMAIRLGMSRVQLADLERSLHAPNATTMARLITGLPGLELKDFFVEHDKRVKAK